MKPALFPMMNRYSWLVVLHRLFSVIFHLAVRKEVTVIVMSPPNHPYASRSRPVVCRVIGYGRWTRQDRGPTILVRDDDQLYEVPCVDEGVTWARGTDTPAVRALLAAEALR